MSRTKNYRWGHVVGMKALLVAISLVFPLADIVCAGELRFQLGPVGLTSLIYDGHEFIKNPLSGRIRPVNHTPKLDGAAPLPIGANSTTWSANNGGDSSAKATFAWGDVVASYRLHPQRLTIHVEVRARGDQPIERLDLSLADLTYPSVPDGRGFEAGMFGAGGTWVPLYSIPFSAKKDTGPPVIRTRYDSGSLALTLDEAVPEARIGIPFTLDKTTKRLYPLWLSFDNIKAGVPVSATVSIRFAPKNATAEDIAGDILDAFRTRHPHKLQWSSRRPIGALFLATSQTHPATNPRGWFLNARDVDVTNVEGVAEWRRRLIEYAEGSLSILKEVGAQGMIVWDPEGQEFASAAFYGDPRLTSRLAPETEFVGEGKKGALDEFFGMFRAEGFRVGVTLRPQKIEFRDGVPRQVTAEDPLAELIAKVSYAQKRWGCTLFYVDSTYVESGPISAAIIRALAEKFPDSLFLPENESLRYFAYTAPLNSFLHHGVAGTPASVLEVYPNAFSAILMSATEERIRAGGDALRLAMERGDIMIFNAWYRGPHTSFLIKVTNDAQFERGGPSE